MFGLFAPKCPLGTAEKTWVERRMLWFAERFGVHRLLNARVVTPTDEFFPDKYAADYLSVRSCLDRMCGYMGVDPQAITLEILPDHAMPNAAGWYQMRARSNICVAESQLTDPTRLMATLAHEVAHDILLRGGHLTGQEADHEQTTDLLPVFLGVGIFGANATIRDASGWEGGMSWWSISHQGYLSSFVLGYALALFAFVRDEESPLWSCYLRPDARETLRKGLRFLRKTGDSLFTPDTEINPHSPPTVDRVLERLAMRSPTFRLAAMWDVIDWNLTNPPLLDAVANCLRDRDDAVREKAAEAVSRFGAAALEAVPQLLELIHDRDPCVRTAAVRALGTLRPPASEVVPELTWLLLDERAATEAAGTLLLYGTEAAPCLPRLLTALERSLTTYTDATPVYFALLRAICPNPRKELREHFGERDPELLRLALNELK